MKQFITLLIIAITSFSYSQLSAVRGKTDYNFWLNLPDSSVMTSNPPVLIFLHGKSLSGRDMNRVRKYGVIREIEKGRSFPAIVVAPQVVSGSWNPDKVLEVLHYIQKTYQTDTTRVYVAGMSLGGYGTLHFAGKHADKITAAVALCGGGNVKDATNLASIPMWIQHGTRDEAVPVRYSREIVAAIRKVNDGKNLIYTEIPGANHGALERVFRGDEMYDWLFTQRRENKGEVVMKPAVKVLNLTEEKQPQTATSGAGQ